MAIDMTSKKFGDVWILGMPFLRYYYTSFNRKGPNDKPIMHMANAGPQCHPQPFNATGHAFLSTDEKQRTVEPIAMDIQELVLPPWAEQKTEDFIL